jgi:hypothetical protein
LLDGLFAHPAWLFTVVATLDIRDGYRGQNEFFRSLLHVLEHQPADPDFDQPTGAFLMAFPILVAPNSL